MKWQPYPGYKPSSVEWLGEVPEDWGVLRLKNIARFGYGDSLAAGDRIPGNYDVYGSNGIVDQHERPNTKGPCLIIGRKGSFGKVAYSENPCFAIDTTYFIDSTLTRNDLRWLYYCLQWLRLDSFTKDSAVPGLSREDAYENFVPLCPINNQRAIAAFLDRETGRIDALMEKKQRQIELLQEKRAALISHAVTKGLDPTVALKDSGVEWLGQIPMHWEVKKVKFLAGILRGKFSHRPRNDPQLYNGPYPFIQTGDIVSANKYITDYQQTLNELGFAISKEFPRGTLVMSIAANIGDLAILEFPACFPDSIVGFFPKAQVDLNYLYYNLESMKQELKITAPLNTQQNLNIERIGPLQTVSPPINEQRQIAVFLDQETAKMEGLITKIQESIDKLKEYRTALISAAVTGQIDVREEAA